MDVVTCWNEACRACGVLIVDNPNRWPHHGKGVCFWCGGMQDPVDLPDTWQTPQPPNPHAP